MLDIILISIYNLISTQLIMSNAIPKNEVKPLLPLLRQKLTRLRERKGFNPERWIDVRTDQFLVYMKKCNLKAAIVSMSGGVDSSLVAALLKRAQDKAAVIPDHPFNPANGGVIIGVAQPFHSTPEIQNRAFEVGLALNVNVITVNRSEEFDSSMQKVEAGIGGPLKPFSKAMCKSYERTPINYLLASHYGG